MVRHVLLELPSLKPPHGHHVCSHTLLLAVAFPAPPSDSPSFLVFFPLPTRPLPPHAAHPRPLPPHAVCLPGHLDLPPSTTVNRGATAHSPCVHLLFGSLFQVAGWGHPGWGPNWKPKAAVQSVSSASSTSSTTASATGWAPCAGPTPCPQGPYFHCLSGVAANGCRPAAAGPFPAVDCDMQCDTQAVPVAMPSLPPSPTASNSPLPSPSPSPSPTPSPSPSATSPLPPASGIDLCTAAAANPCPSGPYYHCLSGPAINGCKAVASGGPFPLLDCTAQCLTQEAQVSSRGS